MRPTRGFSADGRRMEAVVLTESTRPGVNFQMTDVPSEKTAAVAQSKFIQRGRVAPTNSFVEFDRESLHQSIPVRFEQTVARSPNSLAVRTRNNELTYEQLHRLSNQIAHAVLNRLESSPGPVVLLMENDAPLIAAMLALLKAGKPYVPLDSTHPASRNRYIFDDSEATLILTDDANYRLAEELAGAETPIINLDEIGPDDAAESPSLRISPDTPTWILYTSGSTGQPKGVVQTHGNVLHFVMNYTNGLHIAADDRIVLLFSPCVNAGAHEILTALLNGASLHPLNLKREGVGPIGEWIERQQITIYASVPTVFRHFVDNLNGSDLFPSVRLVKMVGEPVYKRDFDAYRRYFCADCLFVNRLGSTETGTIRWCFIDKKTQIVGNFVPVGYPVADNEILLLDDNGKCVATDEIGEIAVKSHYLSPGYWQRPDLTAAVFQDSPDGQSSRIYRTGDMGRMLPNGCLVHCGRKDFQVKIRGHRIEVGEIQMALLDLPAVKEAIVVAQEDQPGDQRLVAYFVPIEQPAPTVSALRRALAQTLPDYMVPSVFVTLDTLPKAPNGKISLSTLPQPDRKRPPLDSSYVGPRTVVEEQLVELWCDVLDVSPIGILDSFFELGGTSLRATQIISRLHDRFGVRLPIQTLFDSPTIDGLAVAVVHAALSNEPDEEIDQILDDAEGTR